MPEVRLIGRFFFIFIPHGVNLRLVRLKVFANFSHTNQMLDFIMVKCHSSRRKFTLKYAGSSTLNLKSIVQTNETGHIA